jgi:hypothetical protein
VGSLAVDQDIAIRTRVVLPTHAIAKGLGIQSSNGAIVAKTV